MMTTEYEFHKNSIITGYLNSFCLACDTFFDDEDAATSHLSTSAHAVKLELSPYLDKFEEQCIRKFNMGYYCQFCNVLLPTAYKVKLHISESTHKQNRGTCLIQIDITDGCVIAFSGFSNIIITDDGWHGLKDDICLICDTEFNDKKQHKENTGHILNVIQSTVRFGVDNAIYREINHSTIHCLTCNLVFPSNILDKHFEDESHLRFYEFSKAETYESNDNKINKQKVKHPNESCTYFIQETEQKDKLDGKEKNIPPKDNTFEKLNPNNLVTHTATSNKTSGRNNTDIKASIVTASDTTNDTRILDSVPKFQKNSVDIDFEAKTGFCRKCSSYIKFDIRDIENHIEKHIHTYHMAPPERYPTHVDKEKYSSKLESTEELDSVETDHDNDSIVYEKKDLADVSKSNEEADSVSVDDFNPIEDTASINSSSNETCDAELETNSGVCSSIHPSRFAKDNKITYNDKNNNAFCRVCQVRLPSSLKSMQEHVKGLIHVKKVAASKVKTTKVSPLKRQKMKSFVKILRRTYHMFSPDDVFMIINEKYVLNELSFLMITCNQFTLRCLLCEEDVPYVLNLNLSLKLHVEGSHLADMWNLSVITSVVSASPEFIREIHPGQFHCGRCNLVVTGWSEMEKHLNSLQHFFESE